MPYTAEDIDGLLAEPTPTPGTGQHTADSVAALLSEKAHPQVTLDTAARAYKEEKLSVLGHALNKAADVFAWLEEVGPQPHPDVLKAQAAGREAMRARPQVREVLQDEQAREASPLAVPFHRYGEASRQLEISKLQFELLVKRRGAGDTLDLERRIAEARVAAIPRDYDEGAFAQVFSDAAERLASTVDVVEDAGVGAAAGAVLGAVPGAVPGILKRDPALALKGARKGALKGASWLGKAGAALGSFRLEAGSAYGELLEATTDDGTTISEVEAAGGAVIYGAFAAGLDMASLGVLLKAAGPLGAAIRQGTGKAAMAELMRDAGWRQIAREVGLRWAKAGGAEGGTEAIQSALEDAVGYFTRSASAGEFQATPQVSLEKAARSAEKGLAGGLATGAVGAGVNMTSQAIARDRARVAGRQVAALAELGDSEAVREAPEAVARMVAEATARDGEPVTHVYVDAGEFMRLLQDGGAREAATELLGEDGPRVLQEAVAVGGKIEVPVAVYLERWGTKPIAKALADHTTTRPGLLTPAEVVAQEKEIQKEAEKIASEAEAPPAEAEFAEGLEEQLVETGLSKSEAKASVAPLRAFVRTQAARFGVDAESLFADWGVIAERGTGEVTPAAGLEQALRIPEPLADDAEVPVHEIGALPPEIKIDARGTPNREAAQQWALGNLRGTFRNDHTGWDVIVSRVGLKKTLWSAVPAEQRILTHLPELLRTAVYASSEPFRNPDRHGHSLGAHRLYAAAVVDGEIHRVSMVVREFTDGASFYRLESVKMESPASLRRAGEPEGLASRQEPGKLRLGALLEGVKRGTSDRLFEAALSGQATPRGFMERQGKRLRIVRNPNADLSTFLHETGHVFLEMFSDLARREDAPQQVRDDWQAVLGWLGSDGKITREQHEQFARGFEAYLMEGKSPSEKLARVFERFKLWLKKLYRTALSLNVELSPEIRGVFDRLLATDREIARAQEASGHTPMPQDVLGMDPEQYQAYLQDMERATSRAARDAEMRVLKDRLREQEAWWKEEFARTREEVLAEYEQLPARKAQQFLLGYLEGVKTEPTRMDHQAVVDVVGKERAKKFLTKKGASHPNDVAELIDYPGKRKRDRGRAMLLDILNLPDRDAWATQRAEALMRDRHGDLLQERDRLRELVAGGLHSEQTGQWLLREWDALRKKAGQAKATLEAVKRAAVLIAERTPVGRLSPQVAQQRERAAAEKAARAAAAGDFEQAAVFKQQQILNMYLYRALRDVKEEMARAEASIEKRVQSKTHRPALAKAHETFLAVHDALLGAVGFTAPVEDVGESLWSLEHAAGIAAAGANPFAFDVDAVRALIARPRDWTELTPQQARTVRDAVKNLKAVADQTNEVGRAEEKQRVEEIVAAIDAEAAALPDLGKAAADRALVSGAKAAANVVVGLHGALVDPEHMFNTLGPTARRVFFDRYLERKSYLYGLAQKVLDPLLKILADLPADLQARRFDPIPELDAELPLPPDVNLSGPRSLMWLFMVALNFGNESNRQRLRAFGWTDEQILDVLDRRLPEPMWKLAQRIWDLFDHELWPLVAEKERRKTGLPPEKIKAASIRTQYGTFRGGYFPAVYDPLAALGDVGERQAQAGVAALFGAGRVAAYTPKSHTRERAETYENILLLDWGVFPSQVSQVLSDVAMDEFVRDAGRILFHPTFQATMYRRLGEQRRHEVRDWLRFVANEQAVSAAAQSNDIARAAGWAKSAMVTQAIGWGANIAISDFSNAFVAMAAGREQGGTGFRYGIPAYLAALPHPLYGRARSFALEHSPELQRRVASFSDERRQRYVRNFGRRFGKYRRTVEAIANTAWWFLEQTDKMSSTQIWLARYWQEKAEGTSEPEAVRLADAAVSNHLPTPDKAQQPKVAREPGSIGGILVFFGYFSKVYNVLYGRSLGGAIRAWVAASRGDATKAQAALKTLELGVRSAAIVFFSNVVGELFSSRGPEEDEEPGAWLMYKMLAGYTNPLPLGASLEPAWRKVVTGETSFYASPRAAPVLSLGEGAIRSLGKVLDDEMEDEDRIWAAVEALITIVPPVTTGRAIPLRQEMKSLKYLEDLLSGVAERTDPFGAASGLLYGERENQGANPLSIMSEAVAP